MIQMCTIHTLITHACMYMDAEIFSRVTVGKPCYLIGDTQEQDRMAKFIAIFFQTQFETMLEKNGSGLSKESLSDADAVKKRCAQCRSNGNYVSLYTKNVSRCLQRIL